MPMRLCLLPRTYWLGPNTGGLFRPIGTLVDFCGREESGRKNREMGKSSIRNSQALFGFYEDRYYYQIVDGEMDKLA